MTIDTCGLRPVTVEMTDWNDHEESPNWPESLVYYYWAKKLKGTDGDNEEAKKKENIIINEAERKKAWKKTSLVLIMKG